MTEVVISEFLASNTDGIQDEDGDSSDWIELHNAGGDPVHRLRAAHRCRVLRGARRGVEDVEARFDA